MSKENGTLHCSLIEEFREYVKSTQKPISQVDHMYTLATNNLQHLSHLKEIALESKKQTNTLERVEEKLLGPATGKDHTDNKTVRLIVCLLGSVILALAFALVFVLTGQRFNFLPIPH